MEPATAALRLPPAAVWHLTWPAAVMTLPAANLASKHKFDITERSGSMLKSNDDEWGLCDHGSFLPADYRDDDEDYEDEWDDYDEPDGDDEWDGYDDESEVQSLARLAAKIEPGRATVAQWAQAIRRLGEQRRSRAQWKLMPQRPQDPA